jgi:hypothetical protein
MLTKTLKRDSAAETSWRPLGRSGRLPKCVERRPSASSHRVHSPIPHVAKVAGKYSPISYTWHVELEAIVDIWLRGK